MDRDIQPAFSGSHVTFVRTWPQSGQSGREGENGGLEEGRSEGWPEDKKRAVSYSSDSNLDVNCRLMSQWTLLGNHGGIQENDARKKYCYTGAR